MSEIKGLYRTKNGDWRFQPSSKGLPKGAPRPAVICLETKDENAAISALMKLRGLDLAAGRPDSRRISEWAGIYLEERTRFGRHQPQTTRQMETALQAFADYLGNPFPDKVRKPDVMAFYAQLQGARTHGTVHRYLRYVRALFFWLIDQRVVGENPAARLRLPVVVQSRRDQFCSKVERDRLLLAAEENPEVQFVMMCGFFLGLRINEIVNARWGWFEEGHCLVRSDDGFRTKTGKARMVPYHSRFAAFIRSLPTGEPEAYVLRPEKKKGKAPLRWDPRVPFSAVCRACGLEWVTPHTMRHTFGSLHAMAGTPELKIRRWMGITQQTLDRHYAGLAPDDAAVSAI